MKILQIFPIGFVSMFYQYNLKMILFGVSGFSWLVSFLLSV